MSNPRAALLAATMLAFLSVPVASWAGSGPAGNGAIRIDPVPPVPSLSDVSRAAEDLGNPINKPITGASESPGYFGGDTPPSLEALQATRAGDAAGDPLKPGRGEQLKASAETYGAQGGLAGRSFALNDLLRHYEPILDTTYDFRSLVRPVGSGQTLMKPPIVSQAAFALALAENGQVARETACIYQITREAELTSAPPNWRSYLVRNWSRPQRPSDAGLPGSKVEVAYWNKWVAEGWALGEKQAVDIFLSDLSRLQADIIGMARFRVLLQSGLVEEPRLAFVNTASQGGHDNLHLGDKVIRITGQPGLKAKPRRLDGDCN